MSTPSDTKYKDQITNTVTKKIQETKLNLFNLETDVLWLNVFLLSALHVIGLYNLVTFNYLENLRTTLWILVTYLISNIGVSAGAHRLWSHKSYKAKLPLRIFLLLCFNMCGQNKLSTWVRNHRMHHKYCNTYADPHTTERGYFYSHIGWVMMKEHPEFTEKSKKHDLSDIMSDPVVAFGEKYFWPLQLFFSFILPSAIPVLFWNESWERAIISQVFIRYMIHLNVIWTLNSVGHRWGTRPYNKAIKPADNDLVNYLTVGEGFHNFHHMFLWDYRSSETGNVVNYIKWLIEAWNKIGLAYDLKYPSTDIIKKAVLQKGDGTHPMMIRSTFSEIGLGYLEK